MTNPLGGPPRKLWTLVLCGLLLASGKVSADPPVELRVATINIRYDNPADGENAWQHRRDRVANVVLENRLDVVGMQEVLLRQLNDLQQRLPDYDRYGVGRDDGDAGGEHAPVFYRKDRLELAEKSTIWLSKTPEVPGSRDWDAAITRTATRCLFRDRSSNRRFVVYNTHFDHRGREARLRSAELLVMRIRAESLPVVLMGDFNCLESDDPYRALTGGRWLLDSRKQSESPPQGPNSTWTGFRDVQPGRRIDFVFVSPPWRVVDYRVPVDKVDGRFVSDHLPVLVTLSLETKDETNQP